MRRNNEYLKWFLFGAMYAVIFIIWYLERHRFWSSPWPMVAFFVIVALSHFIVGLIKWIIFKKQNG